MRSLERKLSSGALAGLAVGLVYLAAAGSLRPDAAQSLGVWTLAGFAAGVLIAVVERVTPRLASFFVRLYRKTPGATPSAVRSLVAGLFCFLALLPGLLELRSRPGFVRFAWRDAIFATLVLLALATSLAFGRVLVVREPTRRGRVVTGVTLLAIAALISGFLGWTMAFTVIPRIRTSASLAVLAAAIVGLARLMNGPRMAIRIAAVLILGAGVLMAGLLEPPRGRLVPRTPLDALSGLFGPAEPPPGDAPPSRDLVALFGRTRSGLGSELDRLVPRRRDLDVVWITVCTLRKDRLGAYGSRAGLTPDIDAVARSAMVFERGYTTFPASEYAMESMFMSLYPFQTPRYRKETGQRQTDEPPWLPSMLRTSGRATFAFTAFGAALLATDFNRFQIGFDVLNPYPHVNMPNAETIAAAFSERISSARTDRPYFAWIELMDTHWPYSGDPGTEAAPGGDEARYDASVRRIDRAVGRVVETLRRRGTLDRTLLVFNADHGEEFGEHGGRLHYSSVYEEQVGVPMIVRVPGLVAGRSPVPVDLTDLAPTVLDVLDLPAAKGAGDSLVPVLLGRPLESFAYSEVLYPELASAQRRMIVDEKGEKLIVNGAGRSQVRELYHLAEDPGERVNLAGRHAPEEALLYEAMRAAAGSATSQAVRFPELPRGPAPSESEEERRTYARIVSEASMPPAEIKTAISRIASIGSDDDLRLALGSLANPDPGVRKAVLDLVSLRSFAPGRDAAVAGLRDADPDVRLAAVGALSVVGTAADAPLLTVSPGQPPDEQVARATLAHRFGDPAPLADLAGRLPSLPPRSCVAVLGVLANDGNREAVNATAAVLLAAGVPLDLRVGAARSLWTVNRPLVLDWIVKAVARGDLSRDFILALVDGLDDEDMRTLSLLLEAASHFDPVVRQHAFDTLSRIVGLDEGAHLVRAWQDWRVLADAPASDDARRSAFESALSTLRAAGVALPAEDVKTDVPPGELTLAGLSLTYPALRTTIPLMLRGTLRGPPGHVRCVASYERDGAPAGTRGSTTVTIDESREGRLRLPLSPVTGRPPTSVRVSAVAPGGEETPLGTLAIP